MKIALVGNPNTGKSSVFNLLTGLRQHVGNFPGVTVDKKVGTVTIAGESHTVVDLPGTYSIYPRSADEQVVYNTLSNSTNPDYPDAVVVVADASNLERNLFLFSQVYDISIPCVLVLNMTDIAQRKGISIDQQQLEATFPGASIVAMNARVGLGKDRLIQSLNDLFTIGSKNWRAFLPEHHLAPIEDLKDQEQEAEARYAKITELMPIIVRVQPVERKSAGSIDRWLVHPVFGYLIFAVILLVIFQFIFSFA